ncbi:hypothetical protein [Microbacterium sp.]|uniref:hypothetical protein n=1 Tax=Microbacterium sp. TaxID=51671 RepID=UPI0031FF2537|nr:hypothetical protein [Microbacterium sp.]
MTGREPAPQGDVELDFENALALAFLAASRWASEVGWHGGEAARTAWRGVAGQWFVAFFGSGFDQPSWQFGMAMAKAAAAVDPTVQSEATAGAGELAERVEAAAGRGTSEAWLALLSPLGSWRANLTRHDRQWIGSRIARVMEALLIGETRDGRRTRDIRAADWELIWDALGAIGVEPTDWSHETPTDGRFRLDGMEWWRPRVVDLDSEGHVGAGALAPPDAHRENTLLAAQPDHFQEAVAWYESEVLPHIADRGGARSQARYGIGDSAFYEEAPYGAQSDEVRWLLWALSDAMLTLGQARAAEGKDAAPVMQRRLPLIRAIWTGEVDLAVHKVMGFGPGNQPPVLGDAKFGDYAIRRAEARDRVRAAAMRFLRAGQDESIDDLSALQLAMAARGARVAAARGSATGCGASSALAVLLALAIVKFVQRRSSGLA